MELQQIDTVELRKLANQSRNAKKICDWQRNWFPKRNDFWIVGCGHCKKFKKSTDVFDIYDKLQTFNGGVYGKVSLAVNDAATPTGPLVIAIK